MLLVALGVFRPTDGSQEIFTVFPLGMNEVPCSEWVFEVVLQRGGQHGRDADAVVQDLGGATGNGHRRRVLDGLIERECNRRDGAHIRRLPDGRHSSMVFDTVMQR